MQRVYIYIETMIHHHVDLKSPTDDLLYFLTIYLLFI